MSGPVSASDLPATSERSTPDPGTVEVTAARDTVVGTLPVRRALPRRERRMVGAWCFLDHMGPVTVTVEQGMDIAPHPHIGLQTLTWLLSGEAVHRDSLGSEQLIRPGEVNLMTAGNGVSHSEERPERAGGVLHGVQLWIAQPEETRHGPAAFEHRADLPAAEIGSAEVTVLVGDLDGLVSPARRDTDHLGADVGVRRGRATLPLREGREHAIAVLEGSVTVDDRFVATGELAYLGPGRDEVDLSAREQSRCLLIGGTPFPEPVLMWWNFVARDRDEIGAAYRDWSSATERYGRVNSRLPRIEVTAPAWLSAAGRASGQTDRPS